jgi:plastocyanin
MTTCTRRLSGLVLVGVVAGAAVGFGGACRGSTAAKKPAVVGVTAHVKVFQFRPSPLKVKVGTTVTWVDDDDLAHTVTSGTRDYAPGDTGTVTAVHKDGLFDFALDGVGKKAAYTFAKAGTFHYFCNRHPGMEAEVQVAAS